MQYGPQGVPRCVPDLPLEGGEEGEEDEHAEGLAVAGFDNLKIKGKLLF